MTPADRAWELLAEGLTPQQVVQRLTPATRPEAVALARRLPLLHERPDDRGAALARLAARAGMRRFRLFFAPDGRVADDRTPAGPVVNPAVRVLPADGGTAEYTVGYIPDRDHFQLLGRPAGEPGPFGCVPRQPLAVSGTGYWSHFADRDAVVAAGGPEAYLAGLQAAGPDGWKAFEAGFTWAEPGRPAHKPKPLRPVVGEHTARVVPPPPAPSPAAGRDEPEAPPPPGRLF